MLGDVGNGSLKRRLLAALKIASGLTDRELTDRIAGRGRPQQPINQLARALEAKGLVLRRRRSDGLIGNYLTNAPLQECDTDKRQKKASRGKELGEDALKSYLKTCLEADGWTVGVSWGKTHGVDIVCTKGTQRWLIEAKGCGSLNAMRVNYFLAILGELLQRMTDDTANYSIALPDMPQFRGLWDRLPPLAKKRTSITALFVSSDGAVRLMH